MDRVRLAVIGAGLIGTRHAALAQGSESCVLVGICDPDPALRAVADELGVALYRSTEDLIERERPEGAIVATPTREHASVTLACMERGVHVLVEKPIADSLDQAQRIVAAARDYGTRALIGHHRRHNPLVQTARELVRGEAIGRLLGFSALWTVLKPDEYFKVPWRRQRPGGGPLLINLIHDLDSVRFICGEVTGVYARTSSAARGFAVEDSLSISLALENGALGTILASDATPAPWSYEATTGENPVFCRTAENCYHFVGTDGSLGFPRMELWRYADASPRGWEHPLECRRIEVAFADPLKAQLEHFCRVIRGRDEPLVSAEEGARSLAVALAAQQSAENGIPVDPARLWTTTA